MGLRILSKSEGGVTQIQKCETCHVTQGRCGALGGQTGGPRGQRRWRLAGAEGEGGGAKVRKCDSHFEIHQIQWLEIPGEKPT